MISKTFDEKKTISKLRWKLIPLIMIMYMVSIMDRVNISFAALEMNHELGITPDMFGFIAGIFFLAYFFFEVPSNVLMHRFGARLWISRILISWGIVTIITGFADTVWHLEILRVLLGVCEAGFYPAMILYLTFWFPEKYFASTVSVFMCGQALTNIITGPISTFIIDNVYWLGLAGWRWLFILEGIPAVLLGIIALCIMVDRPEQAKFLEPEEKQWLLDTLAKERDLKMSKKSVSKWQAFQDKKVWHLSFSYLCYVITLYGLGLWMPQIIKSLSSTLTNTGVGLISAIPYICGGIAMVLVARHSDKTMERRYHVGLPIGIAFFSLIALTMTSDLWISVVLLCVSTAAIYCFVGTFWTLPTMFLAEATAAVGIAIINSVANLGGFIGPYVVGYLKSVTHSDVFGMYFLASFALLGMASVLLLKKRD